MPNAKVEFDRINAYLIKWITEISINNAQVFFDINRVSEGTASYLLNLLFGYNLTDLNEENQNMPGIDLGDKVISKLAFQITSRTDITKFKNALDTFVSKEYINTYSNGLKFLILSNHKLPQFTESFKMKYRRFFDPKNDILKVSDLLNRAKKLYYEDYEKFEAVRDFLEKEFGQAENTKSNSLLSFSNNEEKVKFFKQIYSVNQKNYTEKFIPIEYKSENQFYYSDQITAENWENNGLIILGPSGYGKSVLARLISIELIEIVFPVFLQAKYYEDGIQSIFEKEVRAYNFESVNEFLKIAREKKQRILLILDGLNECKTEYQSKLIFELSKVVKDLDFLTIITTQEQSDILATLGYKEILIQKPSQKIFEKIVYSYGGKNIGKELNTLSPIISSGLEAKMIGEIGTNQKLTKSRHNLFLSFIKLKVKEYCIESFQLMSLIAGTMSNRITFSLSTRTIEELLFKNSINSQIFIECINSGILEEKIGKVSFGHEMFFNFFVTESIIRFAKGSKDIIRTINEPKNYDKKLLIIGAIDDESQLIEVLKSIEDANVFDQLSNGYGGEFSKLWVENQILEILPKIKNEIESSEFRFSEDLEAFELKSNVKFDWTEHEIAIIKSIPGQLLNGIFLEDFLDIVNAMDEICLGAVNKFRYLVEEKSISVRSNIFHTIYIGSWGHQLILTQLFSIIHSGLLNFLERPKISIVHLNQMIENKELSFGQIYLLMLLFRWDNRLNILYAYALNCFQNWRLVPFYLIFQFLDQIRYLYNDNEEREKLIDAIKKMHSETQNVWLSTYIYDALSLLGELEDDADEYKNVVNDEINNLLLFPEDKDACEKAAGIYICQYDHPYTSSYINAIGELTTDKKEIFFEMALQGSHSPLFTISLVLDAYKILGLKALKYIIRWTKTPFEAVSFPQDSLALYIIAFLLLGEGEYPLPKTDFSSLEEKEKSIRLLAEVCYLQNSSIKEMEKSQLIKQRADLFFNLENRFLLDTVNKFNEAFYQRSYYMNVDFKSVFNIENEFKTEILVACRKALKNLDWQKAIFSFRNDNLELNQNAIEIMGRQGSIIDIELLKTLTSDQNYGRHAVEAIKKISGRY